MPLNMPVSMYSDDHHETIGAPSQAINNPSFTRTISNTAYAALAEGPTATIGTWVDTNVVMPYITDRGRPKLPQKQVDEMWQSAGIPDKAPDATRYNDVAINHLLDRAKRRQAMREMDEATEYSWTETPARAAVMLGASMLDPINIATGLFPAAGAARAIGLASTAAKIEALSLAGQTAPTLLGRLAARAGSGAIEGVVGSIPLEATTGVMRNDMGEDYHALEAVSNLAMGGAIGGGLHIMLGSFTPTKVGEKPRLSPVAEKIDTLPPRTRQNALEVGITQVENDLSPTLEKYVDYHHGKATAEEVHNEFKNSTNPENSYVTRNVPELREVQEPPKFSDEHNFDYVGQTQVLKAHGDEIERLSELGLYSKKKPVEKMTQQEAAENFRKQVDNYFNGNLKSSDKLDLGKIPEVYKMTGMSDKPVILREKNIRKISGGEDVYHGHKISSDIIKQLPEQLANPVMVIKSSAKQNPDGIVVLTELKGSDGYPIIAVISPDKTAYSLEVHELSSMYAVNPTKNNGKNLFLEHHKNKRIIYRNKNKVEELRDTFLNNSTDNNLTGGKHEEIDNLIQDVSILDENDLVKYSQTKQSANDFHTQKIVDEIHAQFGEDGAKLVEAGKIEVVNTAADLPGTHTDNVQGMYKDGKVYLVAKNLDPSQVKNVVLHEVGVHANMRSMLGDKGFDNLIKQMDNYLAKNERLREIVDAAVPHDTPMQYHAEERLAYMIEYMPEHGAVRDLLAKVKAWLYKTFPSLQKVMSLNDADIQALALTSLRNYAEKDSEARAGSFYSQAATSFEDEIQTEYEELNKIISKTTQYRERLLANSEVLNHLDNKANFIEALNDLGINSTTAKDLRKDISRAYARAVENLEPNPEQYAINFALNKLDYELQAHRVAVLHDKAMVKKITQHLQDNFASDPKAGLRSLVIGSSLMRRNSRAYVAADAVRNAKRLYTGQLDSELSRAGIRELFYSGAIGEDIQRVMWAIDDGADLSHFAPEAVHAAQTIMKIYDSITDGMRKNGMVVNKIKHYISNQASLHNQSKIRAAGYENWKSDLLQHLDMHKTAEAMNCSINDINDEMLTRIYQGIADGEHLSAGGKKGKVVASGSSLRSVNQQQRKFIFRDADNLINYRNKYGSLDFQAAVISTIEGNARKLGILQTLGVNYERNLRQIARDFINQQPLPEQRNKLRKFADHNMINMLKCVDGRADIPVSEALARFTSNVLATMSMTKLGGATISGLTDLTNAAAYLNRQGMGGTTFNNLELMQKQFSSFSPERKQILGSMGVFAEGVLQNVYRDGMAITDDNKVGQWLSKTTNRFFKMTGLDAWTNSSRLSATDSLMNYVSGFTKHEFNALPETFQKALHSVGLDAEGWELIRQTKQLQADGNHYLVPQEIDNIRDKVQAHLVDKGIAGDILEAATDKYIDKLKTGLTNYYHDALSQMIIEPSAGSKYYQTWGGLQNGTVAASIAKLTMQFKSFSIEFMRKVLFPLINEDTTAGQKAMNIGKYIAATTIVGYAAGALKDISKGRKPREFFDEEGNLSKATIGAALLQGGGLGIFGDFFSGEYNRFGGGFATTLAGPAVGQVAELLSIGASARDYALDGEFGHHARDIGAKLFRFALDNSPYINAFYIRGIVNYLFAYGLQEQLNPGYLNRMERRIEKQNNQEFWWSPTGALMQ